MIFAPFNIHGIRLISSPHCVDSYWIEFNEMVFLIPCSFVWVNKRVERNDPTAFYIQTEKTAKFWNGFGFTESPIKEDVIIAHPTIIQELENEN